MKTAATIFSVFCALAALIPAHADIGIVMMRIENGAWKLDEASRF